MINNLEDLYSAMGGGDDDKPVTNQQRQDWNSYTEYLKKRGMAGDPKLDKNNLGKNMLAQYIKENPNTSLTLDSVIPIQHDFANYRQWSLDQIKQGKMEFAPGTTQENYMRELSRIDGIPGQYTTRHKFSNEYLKTFENGKEVSTENKGFSTVKK